MQGKHMVILSPLRFELLVQRLSLRRTATCWFIQVYNHPYSALQQLSTTLTFFILYLFNASFLGFE